MGLSADCSDGQREVETQREREREGVCGGEGECKPPLIIG